MNHSNRISTPAIATIIFAICILTSGCKQKEPDTSSSSDQSAWVSLFNEGDISQWRGEKGDHFPEAGWTVRDKMLIANETYATDSIRAGNLFTKDKYGDFEFYFEWKLITVGGNSGVKYFVPGKGDAYDLYGPGPEYQILDDANHAWMLEGKMRPNDYHTMGSVYELYAADSSKKVALLGEWNSSQIISRKGQVEHWLNGKKIVEYNRFSDDFKERVQKSKFHPHQEYGRLEKGHIMLQDHGGVICFRNLKIKTTDY